MSVIDVITKSARFVIQRPASILPMLAAVIVLGGVAFTGVLLFIALFSSFATPFSAAAVPLWAWGALALATLLFVFIAIYAMSLASMMIVELYRAWRNNAQLTFMEAFRQSKAHAGLLMRNYLSILVVWLVTLVLATIAVVLLAMLAQSGWAGVIVAVLIGIAFVITGIVLVTYLTMVSALSIVLTREEDARGSFLFKRALDIFREHWHRLIFLYVAVVVVSSVAQAPLQVVADVENPAAVLVLLIPAMILFVALQFVVTAWSGALFAEFYYAYVDRSEPVRKGKVERLDAGDSPRPARPSVRSKKIVAPKGKRVSKN